MSGFGSHGGVKGMHMFFDQIRRQKEGDIQQRAAEGRAAEAVATAQDIERRLDRLTLICMAMWSFLSEKTGVTEEQLMERVKTIDLMDGVADGKLHRQVAKCQSCGRVMSPRHQRCLYCGAEKLQITAFDEAV